MYFDWITWSIWAVGFAVMVIWIFVPVKEYKKLLEKRKQFLADKAQDGNNNRQNGTKQPGNTQNSNMSQFNETKLTEKQ